MADRRAPDYRNFTRAIFEGWPEPYGESIDGGTLQELGHKHGILEKLTRTVPCSSIERCSCAEVYEHGAIVECYVLVDDADVAPLEQHDEDCSCPECCPPMRERL